MTQLRLQDPKVEFPVSRREIELVVGERMVAYRPTRREEILVIDGHRRGGDGDNRGSESSFHLVKPNLSGLVAS